MNFFGNDNAAPSKFFGSSQGGQSKFFGNSPASGGGVDPNSVEGLSNIAQDAGLGPEADAIANPEKKLSFLQRLGAGLGAFSTGDAVYQGIEKHSVGAVAETYVKDAAEGLWSAITGRDIGQTDKKSYKDVLQDNKVFDQLHIANGGWIKSVARFGIGAAADIFLDPTTYFGGEIARGVLKGGEIGADAVKAVGTKIAPELTANVGKTLQTGKDALGHAFVYGYGTSDGVREGALTMQNKIAALKEDIVKSNFSRLGTDTLSGDQAEEMFTKMFAAKRAELNGASTEELQKLLKSDDPLVSKTIEAQIVRNHEFAKMAGIDDPFYAYFPSLTKDKLNNFLEGTRSLKVGSEGYTKAFNDLLSDDQLIKDPATAFSKREFEIAKDATIRDQVRGVLADHGVQAETIVGKTDNIGAEIDAMRANGYRPVYDKGILSKEPQVFYKTTNEAGKEITALGGKIKPIGYLPEQDWKFLSNLTSPQYATIDALGKATGFDKVTNLFKRSVTGLFAPFHVRNFVSGNLQNFEVLGAHALNPVNLADGQKLAMHLSELQDFGGKTINIAGTDFKFSDIAQPFADRFGSSSRYISDVGEAAKNGFSKDSKIFSTDALKDTIKTAGLGQDSIHFRAARAVGNYIETQQKAVAYITAMRQGSTVKEALSLAEKAGFDYRALTPFESSVMRRLIPFYSFTRKNIELQLRTLGEHPERINQILDVIKNTGDQPSAEEKSSLPDYIRESLGIKLKDTDKGLKQYIYSFGTPIEAFTNIFEKNPILRMMSTTNPLFQVPAEIATGKDFFRDQDIKETYNAKDYAGAPQVIKNLLQLQPVEKPILAKGPDGKFYDTGESRIEYVANPERLLYARSLFSARGFTYLQTAFGGDVDALTRVLRLTTGIKPTTFDEGAVEGGVEKQKTRDLQDLLERYGEIGQFNRAFKPKSDQGVVDNATAAQIEKENPSR